MKIMRNDLEILKLNRYAINEPNPAPVNGRGTATKKTKAMVSYFRILLSALFLIFGNPQSIALLHEGNWRRYCSTFLKNNKIKGTNIRLPARATGNA